METIDLTNGQKPNADLGTEYCLTVEFRTGSRYAYYGRTKKECLAKFNKAFGTFHNFIKKEWTIE